MTTLAPNELGADLIWWRTSQGMRTTVSLMWNRFQPYPDSVHLRALLFNPGGEAIATWRMALEPDRGLFVDSAAAGPWRDVEACDGVLALYACTEGDASEAALAHYSRLFPIVDWHAPDGRIATLHSDQVIQRGEDALQRFTEIVVGESRDETNALVFLNGADWQATGALTITITSAAEIVRSAAYARPMQPFTANRVALRELFPDIDTFAAGEPLLVDGTFEARGVRLRPYVETTGARWGVYHAGNVYDWPCLPHFAHAVIGGEVNPVAVLHDAGTRTIVNILHAHGDIEDEVEVDAALFDTDGRCIARRPAWLLAHRHGLARADVAELLPDHVTSFQGHLALSFAPQPGRSVPRHLQALLEVRRADSVCRFMAWSDEWNSRRRLALRDRNVDSPRYRSWFRVDVGTDIATDFSITNAGHPGYDRAARVEVTLHGPAGPLAQIEFGLAPFATRIAAVEELFPRARDALGAAGLGIVLVESCSDLACLGLTRARSTGALSAEHFMSLPSLHDGGVVVPAGS